MFEAEAVLSHMQDIPVTIIQRGEMKHKCCVEIGLFVDQAGDDHLVTAKEEKENILNNKATSVPAEMRDNPDSCRLILYYNKGIVVIPDADPIQKYGKTLSQSPSSLAIADADTNEGQILNILKL